MHFLKVYGRVFGLSRQGRGALPPCFVWPISSSRPFHSSTVLFGRVISCSPVPTRCRRRSFGAGHYLLGIWAAIGAAGIVAK